MAIKGEAMSTRLEQRLETKSFLAAWGGPHGHGRVVKLSDALAFVRAELEAAAQVLDQCAGIATYPENMRQYDNAAKIVREAPAMSRRKNHRPKSEFTGCDRFTMRCPHCETGENSKAAGGSKRCFHCDSCYFVECVWCSPAQPDWDKISKPTEKIGERQR